MMSGRIKRSQQFQEASQYIEPQVTDGKGNSSKKPQPAHNT